MGLSPFSSSTTDYSTNAPNPNPSDFKITNILQIKKHVVVRLRYPDCTNFNGAKICVFRNVTIKQVRAWEEIDPHFFVGKQSPFARFKPDNDGWEMALTVAKIL